MANDEQAADPAPLTSHHQHGLRLHLSLDRRTQLLATGLLVMAGCLVPWTVLLGLTLPPKYDAGHWVLLWTGFDAGLIAVLAYAAWAAWFRRQVVASTAIVAGTLLLCDAWFDIVTSIGHRDQWVTLLTGFGGEVPLALFFFWLYRRIILNTLTAFHQLLGGGETPRRLRDAQIMFLSTRPAPVIASIDPAGGPRPGRGESSP